MSLWIIGARWRRGLRALAAIAIALPALLGMGSWQSHNARVFDNDSFTSLGAFNLLYYRASTTLYLAQGTGGCAGGRPEPGAPRRRNGWANGAEEITDDWEKEQHRARTASVDAAMRDIALEVIVSHPAASALATVLGLYQSLIEVWGALSQNWRALEYRAHARGRRRVVAAIAAAPVG